MANAWITFLTKYYQDRKKKQPGYSYSDAMKDAKIEYNKTNGTASPSKSHKKGKKMRGGKGDFLENAAPVNNSTGSLVKESPEAPPTHKGGAGSVADNAGSVNPMEGGKKSRRRKGTKGKKSRKTKSKKRKSRSSRK